ncbi:MAG: 50S ribosomal protein L7/L12 [Chloroflexi bacterium]|nr:50S ribosomal protein L7/L12 [Chloroflexota bacterium]
MTKEEILEAIKSMSVIDLADLVKDLEEVFGVSAAAPVAVAAPGAAPAAEGASDAGSAEEKTDFKVTLQEIGDKKINVIKAVREVTTLGLKEAKDLVEAAPSVIKEGIGKEEADQIKEKVEAAGAKVTIE